MPSTKAKTAERGYGSAWRRARTAFLAVPGNETCRMCRQNGLLNPGTLRMDGKLCGGVSGSECNFAAWDPNTEMLTFVVGGDGALANGGQQVASGFSADFINSSQFQGAVYATNAVNFGNNAMADGPLVASYVVFSNNVTSDNFPTIQTVPAGMPGNPAVYAQPNPPQLYAG